MTNVGNVRRVRRSEVTAENLVEVTRELREWGDAWVRRLWAEMSPEARQRARDRLEGGSSMSVHQVRYPPIVTVADDKDGGHLPMTGKNAVRRRQEVLEAERQSVMRAQDAALHRALEWTR